MRSSNPVLSKLRSNTAERASYYSQSGYAQPGYAQNGYGQATYPGAGSYPSGYGYQGQDYAGQGYAGQGQQYTDQQGQYYAQMGAAATGYSARVNQSYVYQHDPYVAASAERMTLDSVLMKTATTLGVVIVTALLVSALTPASALPMVSISGCIASLVMGFVVSFKKTVSPALVIAYSVAEGLMIGAISTVFSWLYDGIVTQAVIATVVTAGAVIALYKYTSVKISAKFTRYVMIATVAYGSALLINFVLSLVGVRLGLTPLRFTGLGMVVALIGVVLACMCFLMDLRQVDEAIMMGAPAEESWRAAFGLTVSLVWIYIEILRIIAYLRSFSSD